jgi:hypothetical protein
MTANLIPTIVTNKNGVITTVYRKPSKALAGKPLAPVASGDTKSVYALKKKLTERLKQFDQSHYESIWRKRVIKEAVESNDVLTLKRLDQHFDVTADNFRETFHAIELAGMDRNDDTLFQTVSDFMILSPRFAGDKHIVGFLPMLTENPELLQEVAHYRNVIAAANFDHVPTVEDVTTMMEGEDRPSPDLPAFLAATVERSSTPVNDYNLIAKTIANHESWHAYTYFGGWDRQAVTYMAETIRQEKAHPDLLKRITRELMPPRMATEFVAVVSSVSNLLGVVDSGYESHICGPNGVHVRLALSALGRFEKRAFPPKPIDTADDLAHDSAQVRFILTMNNRVLDEYGDLDQEIVDLLRDHSSVQEVNSIVNLFNDRDVIDVALAREHLADDNTAPLTSGWL